MSTYRITIAQLTDSNPRHVEAHMRAEHGTLDALSPTKFATAVRLAAKDAADCDDNMNELIAQSYGL